MITLVPKTTRQFLSLFLLGLAFFTSASAVSAPIHTNSQKASKIIPGRNPFPERYIVVLKDEVLQDDVEVIADDLRILHGGTISTVFKHALKGFVVTIPRQAAEKLSDHPLVRFVEEDGQVLLQSGSQDLYVAPAATTLNAPAQLDRIDDRTGLDSTYNYCWSGAEVNAYVVDSGIWADHDEFRSKSCQGTYGPTRVRPFFNFYFDSYRGTETAPCPTLRATATEYTSLNAAHGTAVASMLGGLEMGAAPAVNLYSVRVFDCDGAGWVHDIANGLDEIVARGAAPAVVNMSFAYDQPLFGDPGIKPLSAIDIATQGILNRGFTVVAAAGNYRKDATGFTPARVPGVIVASATTKTDQVWVDPSIEEGEQDSGSNLGTKVDIFAVGVDVKAAHFAKNEPAAKRMAGTSGTSFAAPLVSGIAARWLDGYPGETGAQIRGRIISGGTSGVIGGERCVSESCAPNLMLYKAYERCSVVCGP